MRYQNMNSLPFDCMVEILTRSCYNESEYFLGDNWFYFFYQDRRILPHHAIRTVCKKWYYLIHKITIPYIRAKVIWNNIYEIDRLLTPFQNIKRLVLCDIKWHCITEVSLVNGKICYLNTFQEMKYNLMYSGHGRTGDSKIVIYNLIIDPRGESNLKQIGQNTINVKPRNIDLIKTKIEDISTGSWYH